MCTLGGGGGIFERIWMESTTLYTYIDGGKNNIQYDIWILTATIMSFLNANEETLARKLTDTHSWYFHHDEHHHRWWASNVFFFFQQFERIYFYSLFIFLSISMPINSKADFGHSNVKWWLCISVPLCVCVYVASSCYFIACIHLYSVAVMLSHAEQNE